MRWLIIQSDGAHRGQDGWTANHMMRECRALHHALNEIGEEADMWGKRHDNFGTTPDFNGYDAIILIENYEWEWLPDFDKINKPVKLQWIIDLHCQGHGPYDRWSDKMDIILHSTRSLMPDYKRRHPGQKHVWFPNATDTRYFDIERHPTSRQYDLSFIGTRLPQRATMMDRLAREAGCRLVFATGIDYLDELRRTRISANIPIGCDINYRNWESMGMGCCLLTREVEDMQRLGFYHLKNCLLYNTVEEAVQLAKTALAEGTWERIGEQGYALAMENSYLLRMTHLARTLLNAQPSAVEP